MPLSLPQNSAEAAYLAFAMTEELLDLLIRRKLLTDADGESVFMAVAKRLEQGGSFDSQRAAKFVADRMAGKK